MARIVDQRDHGGDIARRPFTLHQLLARLVGVFGGADQLDHLVDIGDGDGESDEHMGAVARLAEKMFGPPVDHLFAERQEQPQEVLQIHHQRAAVIQRHHVGAERRLQGGEAIKLVEHNVRHRVAAQFDDNAIAIAIGLVAQRGNAFELLLAHQFADALDHMRLVHLIGDFGDDDGFPIAAQRFKRDLAAHHNGAAAEMIGGANALAAQNDAAGREIRARHDADEVVDRKRRVVDQRDAGVDHLAEIVRRNVGGHADRNAAGAVDQEIGKTRRQHHRLAFGIIVIGLEVDGIFVEVFDQRTGDALEAHLGVTHGRRRIAVDRTEIPLPIHQRQAHGKILRHAHKRVIHRLVAVRMIFTDNVADDARRLAVGLVPLVAVLVHRVEDAPMHRLEPVARVRQRPRHDHAHGVIEVALFHFLGDRYRANIGGAAVCRRCVIFVGHAIIPGKNASANPRSIFIADRAFWRHLFRPLI